MRVKTAWFGSKKIRFILGVFFLFPGNCVTQMADSLQRKWTFSGGLELYYAWSSFSQQNSSSILDPAICSFHAKNDVAIQMGFVKASYQDKRWKSNIALMLGTYAEVNLAQEPDFFRSLYEVSLGHRLSKTHHLWLEAGILPSHIGFETPFGLDNPTLTRSLVADNSPYFHTGVQCTYISKSERWLMKLLMSNGWQKINRATGDLPAFGHQISYQPKEKLLLNSSSFIGTIQRGGERPWRLYHHFFLKYDFHPRWEWTTGFDFGVQQILGGKDWGTWWTPVSILKCKPVHFLHAALRVEAFSDPSQLIVQTSSLRSLQVFGGSLNVDFKFHPRLWWRMEGRFLFSPEGFSSQIDATNNPSGLSWVTASIGYK